MKKKFRSREELIAYLKSLQQRVVDEQEKLKQFNQRLKDRLENKDIIPETNPCSEPGVNYLGKEQEQPENCLTEKKPSVRWTNDLMADIKIEINKKQDVLSFIEGL